MSNEYSSTRISTYIPEQPAAVAAEVEQVRTQAGILEEQSVIRPPAVYLPTHV